MYQPDSAIIDFYPTDFKIDLNGKKYAWQGVALLPFVDEKRLLSGLEGVYSELSERESERNAPGQDRLFISRKHPWFDSLLALYESADNKAYVDLDATKGRGTTGTVRADDEGVRPGQAVTAPVPALHEFMNDGAVSCGYLNPQFAKGYIFPSKLLDNVKMPEKTIKPKGYSGNSAPGGYRPYTGFQRARGGQGPNTVGNRMLNHMVRGRGGGPPQGQRYPPPQRQQQPYQRYPPPQRQPYREQNRSNNQYNPYRR